MTIEERLKRLEKESTRAKRKANRLEAFVSRSARCLSSALRAEAHGRKS